MTKSVQQDTGTMRPISQRDKCSGHALSGALLWPLCIRCKRLDPSHNEQIGVVYVHEHDPQRVATCDLVRL